MSFSKQSEVELPWPKLLHKIGGRAQPKELYPKVAKLFPLRIDEDLSARLPSSPSYRGHNLVQHYSQGIGVVRQPVQLFDLDPEFFDLPRPMRRLNPKRCSVRRQ